MEVVTRHLEIVPGLKMPQKSKRRWSWSTKANFKRFWIIRGWFPVFDYALFRPGSEFIRELCWSCLSKNLLQVMKKRKRSPGRTKLTSCLQWQRAGEVEGKITTKGELQFIVQSVYIQMVLAKHVPNRVH